MVKNLPQYGRPRFHPWVGKIPWRREWQPIPIILPEESYGQRSLVGYSPWDRKRLDTTDDQHLLPLWLSGASTEGKWEIRWRVNNQGSEPSTFLTVLLLSLYVLPFQIIFPLENISAVDYNMNLLGCKHILAFWHYVMLQFYFVHSLPQTWYQPFYQGVLVPFDGE